MAGFAEVTGAHEHGRHADVEAGCGNTVEGVAGVAGRQVVAGFAAGDVLEMQVDGRCRAGHAGDARVALVTYFAARRANGLQHRGAGVDVMHAHLGFAVAAVRCAYQAALQRKHADRAQQVAASRLVIDERRVDHDLNEFVIDIDAGPRRTTDQRDFAGDKRAAADAVDLARMRRAHDAQQQPPARIEVARQVRLQKIRAFGSAAAKQHARIFLQIVHRGPRSRELLEQVAARQMQHHDGTDEQ